MYIDEVMRVAERISVQRILFPWILSPQKDLVFYIGSALAGWLYVAIIVYAIVTLENPLKDALAVVHLGQFQIALTLQLLVVLSWGLILDAPHVWATLARTLFDPDEWKVRKREIWVSFVWFFVGPMAILLPYLLGSLSAPLGFILPAAVLSFGAVAYFVFFRLWAYYHVVRQHWGFFSLYKRKAGDHGSRVNRVDWWFFNLSLYMPLVMFMTSPFYLKTPGYMDIGLMTPIVGVWSLATLLYPCAWVLYLGVILFYLGFQLKLWLDGSPLNGSKLLYMALIVPLHLVAYSHPIMAVFLVPLVTVGHNIQYHCIIYSYAPKQVSRQNGERVSLGAWIVQKFLGLCVGGTCLHPSSVPWTVDRFSEALHRVEVGQELAELPRDDGRRGRSGVAVPRREGLCRLHHRVCDAALLPRREDLASEQRQRCTEVFEGVKLY